MYLVEYRMHHYVVAAPTDTVAKTRLIKELNYVEAYPEPLPLAEIAEMTATRMPTLGMSGMVHELEPGLVEEAHQ
jgi:hypothetical protein